MLMLMCGRTDKLTCISHWFIMLMLMCRRTDMHITLVHHAHAHVRTHWHAYHTGSSCSCSCADVLTCTSHWFIMFMLMCRRTDMHIILVHYAHAYVQTYQHAHHTGSLCSSSCVAVLTWTSHWFIMLMLMCRRTNMHITLVHYAHAHVRMYWQTDMHITLVHYAHAHVRMYWQTDMHITLVHYAHAHVRTYWQTDMHIILAHYGSFTWCLHIYNQIYPEPSNNSQTPIIFQILMCW